MCDPDTLNGCYDELFSYSSRYESINVNAAIVIENNLLSVFNKLKNGLDVFDRTSSNIIPYNNTNRASDLALFNASLSNYNNIINLDEEYFNHVEKLSFFRVGDLINEIISHKLLFQVKKVILINYNTGILTAHQIKIYKAGNPAIQIPITDNSITAPIKIGNVTASTASPNAYVATENMYESVVITLPPAVEPGDYRICKIELINLNSTGDRLLGCNVLTLDDNDIVLSDNFINSNESMLELYLFDNLTHYNITYNNYIKLVDGNLSISGSSGHLLRYVKDIFVYTNPYNNNPLSLKIKLLDSNKNEIQADIILSASMYPVSDFTNNFAEYSYLPNITDFPQTMNGNSSKFFHFILTDINDLNEIIINTTFNINDLSIALIDNNKNTLYNGPINPGYILDNIQRDITNNDTFTYPMNRYIMNQVDTINGFKKVEYNLPDCIQDNTCLNINDDLITGFNYRFNNNPLCKMLDDNGNCPAGLDNCNYIQSICKDSNMCYYLNGACSGCKHDIFNNLYNPDIEICDPNHNYPKCSFFRITNMLVSFLEINYIKFKTPDMAGSVEYQEFVHYVVHPALRYNNFDNSGLNVLSSVPGTEPAIIQASLDFNQELPIYQIDVKFTNNILTAQGDYHIKVEIINKSGYVTYTNEFWKKSNISNLISDDLILTLFPYQMGMQKIIEPIVVQSNLLDIYPNNYSIDSTKGPKPGIGYIVYDSILFFNNSCNDCIKYDKTMKNSTNFSYTRPVDKNKLQCPLTASKNVTYPESLLLGGCYCNKNYYKLNDDKTCSACTFNSTDPVCNIIKSSSECVLSGQTNYPTDWNQRLSNGCFCSTGYERNTSATQCLACQSNSQSVTCNVIKSSSECPASSGQTNFPTDWTQKLNNGCYCAAGYTKSGSNACTSCQSGDITPTCNLIKSESECLTGTGQTNYPTHWSQKLDNGCYCNTGYKRNVDANGCSQCLFSSQEVTCNMLRDEPDCSGITGAGRLPTFWSQKLANGCYCQKGFTRDHTNNTCVPCRAGYTMDTCNTLIKDGQCSVPDQTFYPTHWSQKLNSGCYCATGYERNVDATGCSICNPDSASITCNILRSAAECPTNLGQTNYPTDWFQRLVNGCYCDIGYSRNSNATECNACAADSIERTCVLPVDPRTCSVGSNVTPTHWSQRLSNGCYCQSGYKKDSPSSCAICQSYDIDPTCNILKDATTCPTNEGQTFMPTDWSQKLDSGCYCNIGYKTNLDSTACTPCTIDSTERTCTTFRGDCTGFGVSGWPTHWSQKLANGCYCQAGYTRASDTTCTECTPSHETVTCNMIRDPSICPAGAGKYPTHWSQKLANGCYCQIGFTRSDNDDMSCVPCTAGHTTPTCTMLRIDDSNICPAGAGAYPTHWSQKLANNCYCQHGFKRINENSCAACNAGDADHTCVMINPSEMCPPSAGMTNIPTDWSQKLNNNCYCDIGYKRNPDGASCAPCEQGSDERTCTALRNSGDCPAGADRWPTHWAQQKLANNCYCQIGFTRSGLNSCTPCTAAHPAVTCTMLRTANPEVCTNIPGAGVFPTHWDQKLANNCYCQKGFKRNGENACAVCQAGDVDATCTVLNSSENCPTSAGMTNIPTDWSQKLSNNCYCDIGYKKTPDGASCTPCTIDSTERTCTSLRGDCTGLGVSGWPTHWSQKLANGCYCQIGFTRAGNNTSCIPCTAEHDTVTCTMLRDDPSICPTGAGKYPTDWDQKLSSNCYCQQGFIRNGQNSCRVCNNDDRSSTCISINPAEMCPASAGMINTPTDWSQRLKNNCYCRVGYKKTSDSESCTLCMTGSTEITCTSFNGGCTGSGVGSYPTDWSQKLINNCYCQHGYQRNGNATGCIPCTLTSEAITCNSIRKPEDCPIVHSQTNLPTHWSQKLLNGCYCNYGRERNDDADWCNPCNVNSEAVTCTGIREASVCPGPQHTRYPTHWTQKINIGCYCATGYERHPAGTVCVPCAFGSESATCTAVRRPEDCPTVAGQINYPTHWTQRLSNGCYCATGYTRSTPTACRLCGSADTTSNCTILRNPEECLIANGQTNYPTHWSQKINSGCYCATGYAKSDPDTCISCESGDLVPTCNVIKGNTGCRTNDGQTGYPTHWSQKLDDGCYCDFGYERDGESTWCNPCRKNSEAITCNGIRPNPICSQQGYTNYPTHWTQKLINGCYCATGYERNSDATACVLCAGASESVTCNIIKRPEECPVNVGQTNYPTHWNQKLRTGCYCATGFIRSDLWNCIQCQPYNTDSNCTTLKTPEECPTLSGHTNYPTHWSQKLNSGCYCATGFNRSAPDTCMLCQANNSAPTCNVVGQTGCAINDGQTGYPTHWSQKLNNGCYCDFSYERNNAADLCNPCSKNSEAITCNGIRPNPICSQQGYTNYPTHWSQKINNGCYCATGYERNFEATLCRPCAVESEAPTCTIIKRPEECPAGVGQTNYPTHWDQKLITGCYCAPGFIRSDSYNCIHCQPHHTDSNCTTLKTPEECPTLSGHTNYPTHWSQKLNSGCYCATGFNRVSPDTCMLCESNDLAPTCNVIKGDTGCRTDDGQIGFPTHWSQKLDNGCYCDFGYERNGEATWCNLCLKDSTSVTCNGIRPNHVCPQPNYTNYPTHWSQKLKGGCYCATGYERNSEATVCTPCMLGSEAVTCNIIRRREDCPAGVGQTNYPTHWTQKLSTGCYCTTGYVRSDTNACVQCQPADASPTCTMFRDNCLQDQGETGYPTHLSQKLINGCYCAIGYRRDSPISCTGCVGGDAHPTCTMIRAAEKCPASAGMTNFPTDWSQHLSNNCYCDIGYKRNPDKASCAPCEQGSDERTCTALRNSGDCPAGADRWPTHWAQQKLANNCYCQIGFTRSGLNSCTPCTAEHPAVTCTMLRTANPEVCTNIPGAGIFPTHWNQKLANNCYCQHGFKRNNGGTTCLPCQAGDAHPTCTIINPSEMCPPSAGMTNTPTDWSQQLNNNCYCQIGYKKTSDGASCTPCTIDSTERTCTSFRGDCTGLGVSGWPSHWSQKLANGCYCQHGFKRINGTTCAACNAGDAHPTCTIINPPEMCPPSAGMTNTPTDWSQQLNNNCYCQIGYKRTSDGASCTPCTIDSTERTCTSLRGDCIGLGVSGWPTHWSQKLANGCYCQIGFTRANDGNTCIPCTSGHASETCTLLRLDNPAICPAGSNVWPTHWNQKLANGCYCQKGFTRLDENSCTPCTADHPAETCTLLRLPDSEVCTNIPGAGVWPTHWNQKLANNCYCQHGFKRINENACAACNAGDADHTCVMINPPEMCPPSAGMTNIPTDWSQKLNNNCYCQAGFTRNDDQNSCRACVGGDQTATCTRYKRPEECPAELGQTHITTNWTERLDNGCYCNYGYYRLHGSYCQRCGPYHSTIPTCKTPMLRSFNDCNRPYQTNNSISGNINKLLENGCYCEDKTFKSGINQCESCSNIQHHPYTITTNFKCDSPNDGSLDWCDSSLNKTNISKPKAGQFRDGCFCRKGYYHYTTNDNLTASCLPCKDLDVNKNPNDPHIIKGIRECQANPDDAYCKSNIHGTVAQPVSFFGRQQLYSGCYCDANHHFASGAPVTDLYPTLRCYDCENRHRLQYMNPFNPKMPYDEGNVWTWLNESQANGMQNDTNTWRQCSRVLLETLPKDTAPRSYLANHGGP